MELFISKFLQFFTGNEKLTLYLFILSIIVFIFTLILFPLILIKIPEDYCLKSYTPSPKRGFVSHIVKTGLKNFIGILLFIMGIIMLFIPGQGLLTMLAGILMMNIPGKRKLECHIIKQKKIFNGINTIRKKAHSKPLLYPDI